MDQQPRSSEGEPDAAHSAEPRPASMIPEIVERGTNSGGTGWDSGALGAESARSGPFGPRSFRGGRIQVYGCSPGCLLISVVVSLILTLILNAII